jgi:hypothetical protein
MAMNAIDMDMLDLFNSSDANWLERLAAVVIPYGRGL